MSNHTKIEWTDATWNPITGCSVVSPGCTNCYAMQLAGTRLRNHPSRTGLTRESAGRHVWNGQVRLNEEWLLQPWLWRRPRRIFVCAHGDLFHESVPDEWIDRVFAVMALAPWHQFQVLTKRAQRMYEYLRGAGLDNGRGFAIDVWLMGANTADDVTPEEESRVWALQERLSKNLSPVRARWPLANVHVGVSAEDQRRYDERVGYLRAAPAAVRWVSAEPLLGPIRGDLSGIDWVVAGGESGHRARPMHPDWARSLRDQCAAAGVPYFFKQWGEWAPHECVPGGDEGGDLRRDHVRYLPGDGREPDGHFRRGDAAVARVGKKVAGRLLDGVEHNAWPVTP